MFKRKSQVIYHMGAYIVRVGFPYWHYRIFIPRLGCIGARDTERGAYQLVLDWFNSVDS